MNVDDLENKLKTALFARRIPFNIYLFKDNSLTVIATIRGKRMSINTAYSVKFDSVDKKLIVSEYGRMYTCNSAGEASSLIVSMVRKNEMIFSKYTKK